ncbi:exodeoxyribonuclease VII large subunit [Desulfoscipio gibsoniae]|uniref:Exodeoxyribonuclease 7 large subunit n=1 Tax=Desulfoscipio gibsoniae DSM 7213 TaxID=767817 RepID=R4KFR7_9FIRM|nr:exodeoxyribonuclease VII large subunit [Desulfoscipio gibsoniae]AGL02013.1 exodeoxyribonuclease VII, large subunit [Desulfoscipio gibsoniae DSM 7213]
MQILTVRQLTGHIKDLLENDHRLADLWVKGEISNYKKAASGHIYFTLKDNYSCVRVVMFRSRARYLQCRLQNGMAVRVRGYVTVYDRDGQYQLYAEQVEPDGTGALFAALEKLKQQLAAEGLFDNSRKKALPRFPRYIGIVTSPTGAAVRDMLHILRRRWPQINIILAPVAVQGDAAPGEVARAMDRLNRLDDVDLIIVGRGGGSLEELWAFNTELVVRSIAASRIPVISAVGHETDFTLADLAADLRAPTPSAAAELAVPDRLEMKRLVDMHRARMTRCLSQQISSYRQRLRHCAGSRAMARPVDMLVEQRRQTLDMLERQLAGGTRAITNSLNNRLALLAGCLDALSPLATLARGYSYVLDPHGAVLRDARRVQVGDPVQVHLHRGAIKCMVKEIK